MTERAKVYLQLVVMIICLVTSLFMLSFCTEIKYGDQPSTSEVSFASVQNQSQLLDSNKNVCSQTHCNEENNPQLGGRTKNDIL